MSDPVVFPKANNRYWPLPPDYYDDGFTSNGRRLARINACRIRDTPENAAASWQYFCNYYLMPDTPTGFDPGFYKPPIYPAAPGHYWLVRWLNQYRYVVAGCPRGFGKSTVKRSIILHRLVSWPRTEINTYLSKDDFVIEEFYRIKNQIQENPKILEDFGELRRDRGDGIWNNHELTLGNNAILRGFSIDGRKRGPRCDLAVFDDIEDDENYRLRTKETLAELKQAILKIVAPMMEWDSQLLLLGTMVGQNSFLYHAVCTNEDSRFQSVKDGGRWYKINIPAEDKDGRNAWCEKYTKPFLKEKMDLLGIGFYGSEYMGTPRSESDACFDIHTAKHEYIIECPDPTAPHYAPFQTDSTVKFSESIETPDGLTFESRETIWSQHVNNLRRTITVDYAEGDTSSAHDYSAIIVGGLDTQPIPNLWVLDAWQGKCSSTKLAEEVWKLAKTWKVSTIAVEAVATQMEVMRFIRQYGASHNLDNDIHGWLPSVIPLKYPSNLSKPARISHLEWRFVQGRIKFPSHLKLFGAIRELYEQVRNFTLDLKGLPHDDLIDALAMMQFVFRSYISNRQYNPTVLSIEDRLLAGELYFDATQIPLISAVDPRKLSAACQAAIRSAIIDDHLQKLQGIERSNELDNDPAYKVNSIFKGLEL